MESVDVMVAVSKHSSSVSAIKWALSNNLVSEGGIIKLVHVRPHVRSIPTPMGNYVPVKQVSPEIVAAYMRDIQSRTEQHLQVHQLLCDKWKVHAEFVIVESDLVPKALLELISRLGVKKFVMGTSTSNAFMRKLKGPSITEYIAKNAAESCTVLVVSRNGLVSVKQARYVASPPLVANANATLGPTGYHVKDVTTDDSLVSQAGALTRSHPNFLDSSPLVQGDITGFISQPLPIQREKAASNINLGNGGSNLSSSKKVRPKGNHIILSPFWSPSRPLKVELSSGHKKEISNNCRDNTTPEQSIFQVSQEANIVGSVPPLSAVDIWEDIVSHRGNAIRDQGDIKAISAALVGTKKCPFALNEGLLCSSTNRQDVSAAVQINRLFQTLEEDKQMIDMLSGLSPDVESIAVQDHNCDDQSAALSDLDKLKLELELARQRVIKAEEAAASATHKAIESDAYAKEETKRREEALIAAELARKAAAEAARKFDEASIALEAAKSAAEREAQRRREAEDQARKEALTRQEAMAVLIQTKTKFREYSYEEIKGATNCFSEDNQIGEGGYGVVYRGKLHHTTVAIKVLKKAGVQGPQEFQQEVVLLGHMHHPHMVLLLGACPEEGCLVYEYLANGSLEDRLLCKGDTPPLPWHARFRIAAEVATALLFLHASKPDPVVHRDLKPANILLDQNFVSKVGDVGLARLVPAGAISYSITEYRETVPVGTFAYIDPEYQRTGVFCPRSDVYALGLIMLQLLTGKGAIGVTTLVENALEVGTLNEVLDPAAGKWPIHEALEIARLGLQCSELRRKNRPDLETFVLPKLEKLRAFADEYAAQVVWSKHTISESRQVVPSFFLCPIFKDVMEDPHIAADGFTYEYKAIKQWLQHHNTSPMTNLKLSHKHLTPNHSLRSAISEWRQRLLCAGG